MKWSWKIARFWGIDIYMHATFLLIVLWVAFSYWVQFHNWDAVLGGIAFILALFVCVVLHEYGHALTARRFGVRTRDITLYPIGGVARLERIPDKPEEELWVAIAGPAVTLAIAIVLFIVLVATGSPITLRSISLSSGSFIARLFAVNVLLFAFNLLPAFPMDGGRVLRALLAMRMDYLRATQIAAGVGQAMAFLFGLIGLMTDPWLLFIALFVWIGAEQESSMARIKNSLGGIPVSRAMQTNFQTMSPQDTLARAVELILSSSQTDFPVVQDARVVGILERDTFIRALARGGQNQPVVDVMRRNVPEVDTHEMVESALARLEQSGEDPAPLAVEHRDDVVSYEGASKGDCVRCEIAVAFLLDVEITDMKCPFTFHLQLIVFQDRIFTQDDFSGSVREVEVILHTDAAFDDRGLTVRVEDNKIAREDDKLRFQPGGNEQQVDRQIEESMLGNVDVHPVIEKRRAQRTECVRCHFNIPGKMLPHQFIIILDRVGEASELHPFGEGVDGGQFFRKMSVDADERVARKIVERKRKKVLLGQPVHFVADDGSEVEFSDGGNVRILPFFVAGGRESQFGELGNRGLPDLMNERRSFAVEAFLKPLEIRHVPLCPW